MSRVHSIEELKKKCAEKNMPLEKMRFFIGINNHEPKCFGVYQDEKTGNWIVYKNKANGERAIRYCGPDEARAAQEIWRKIGDEIKLRKDIYANPYDELIYDRSTDEPSRLSDIKDGIKDSLGAVIEFLTSYSPITVIIVFTLFIMIMEYFFPTPDRGYYRINDDVYYCLSNSWYLYDSGSWVQTYLDEDDIEDYYLGEEYSSSFEVSDFEDTDYYTDYIIQKYEEDNNDYDDDYEYDDDDYDYDYDNWDAGDTDWDSDW